MLLTSLLLEAWGRLVEDMAKVGRNCVCARQTLTYHVLYITLMRMFHTRLSRRTSREAIARYMH